MAFDLDDEELKATRKLNGSNKNVGSMEKDIKILEEMLKTRKEQKEIIECAGGYCGNCNPDIKALENAIQTMKAYKDLKENSIPVSLVEEKRTKLKEQYNKVVNEINNQGMIDQLIDFKEVSAKLEMCEELLEKRK